MSCQPGRVATSRLASTTTRAQRLVRDAPAAALRDRCARWPRGRRGSRRCPRRGGSASGSAQLGGDEAAAVGRRERDARAASAPSPSAADPRTPGCSQRERARPAGGGRRLIEDARVVQEREEQMEEVLARGTGRGCCAQEGGRALEHALAQPSNAASAHIADRAEQPGPEIGRDRRPRRARSRPSCRRTAARSARARRDRRAPRRACPSRDRRDRPRWSRRAGACAATRRRPARTPGPNPSFTRAPPGALFE